MKMVYKKNSNSQVWGNVAFVPRIHYPVPLISLVHPLRPKSGHRWSRKKRTTHFSLNFLPLEKRFKRYIYICVCIKKKRKERRATRNFPLVSPPPGNIYDDEEKVEPICRRHPRRSKFLSFINHWSPMSIIDIVASINREYRTGYISE